MLHLASPAIASGGRIPERHTCDGRDETLPLAWTGVPVEAKSLALVCSDPDAPRGTFYHWAVYNIPPDGTRLPAYGVPEAVNDFGKAGYGGPCPLRWTRSARQPRWRVKRESRGVMAPGRCSASAWTRVAG
jgi:phosphatidylethanolamine-binding protein (PEBP) family uncharacterized protein